MSNPSLLPRDAEALALTREMVDDIELARLPITQVVLKARRLYKLVDDVELGDSALRETIGYYPDEPGRWFGMTGRDKLKPPFYGSSAALLEMIDAYRRKLQALDSVLGSGGYKGDTFTALLAGSDSIAVDLVALRMIESTIATLLHTTAVKHLYRLSLADRQSSMFQRAQHDIDELLAGLGAEALQKLDSAHERLKTGSPEAISHSLTSCRRLIEQAADALFPATTETRDLGGTVMELGQQQVLNRLKAYIDDVSDSESSKTRLKQSLRNLWSRTSAGVHADVTAAEAEYIYLIVYITIGELISMRTPEPQVQVTVE